MKTCAVIIATWHDQRWIMDAVNSAREQELPEGWTLDLRIGVDGCEETSAVLTDNNVPHWFQSENTGPYPVRNTLIGMKRADAYLIHDGDDVMMPGYVRALIESMGDGIAGGMRQHVDENLEPIAAKPFRWQNGPALFSHEAMTQLGGFREWPCAADADAITRARALGIRIKRTTEGIYLRRRHEEALTVARRTGMGSDLRVALKVQGRRLAKEGQLYVEPAVVEMERR